MKEIVEQLVALSKQMQPLQLGINDHVCKIAVEFAIMDAARYGSGDYPTKVSSINDWHFNGDSIQVNWSETWNYGGYAEGNFFFPAVYLYGDEFEKYRQICEQIITTRQEAKRARERLEKVNQYNKLTEELGIKP